MDDKTKLGLGILAASLVLGILGDALLKVAPWGLNVLLWLALLTLGAAALARWRHIRLAGGGRWLILPALAFAGGLAWRDSVVLGLLNILAALIALTLLAQTTRSGQIRLASMTDYGISSVFAAVFGAMGVAFLTVNDIVWQSIPRNRLIRVGLPVARGLMIGLPLVACFGGLFVAADAVFQGMVSRLFNWDIRQLVVHLFLIFVLTWVIVGFLRLLLIGPERANVSLALPSSRKLGIIEIGIVLGMLDALFLAFVLVQFRYFFGGAEMVEASSSLTYAEYARRGFFELVTAAALMLPLLLAVDWAVRKDNPTHRRIFSVLLVALVLLLFVVMASAFQRMRLYQSEFGLTELRLYTTVFMGWIGTVFLWFLATVARGQRERFAFGMLVSGFLAIASLNAINPDEFIVRTNVDRAKAEQPLDSQYAAWLSADAVPVLVEMLPEIPENERKLIADNILKRWSAASNWDWRSWNWGRMQAQAAVGAKEELLRQIASQ